MANGGARLQTLDQIRDELISRGIGTSGLARQAIKREGLPSASAAIAEAQATARSRQRQRLSTARAGQLRNIRDLRRSLRPTPQRRQTQPFDIQQLTQPLVVAQSQSQRGPLFTVLQRGKGGRFGLRTVRPEEQLFKSAIQPTGRLPELKGIEFRAGQSDIRNILGQLTSSIADPKLQGLGTFETPQGQIINLRDILSGRVQ